MTVYNITLLGSLVGEAFTPEDARRKALRLSHKDFPKRLIRVYDMDNRVIIFECRNGVPVYDSKI